MDYPDVYDHVNNTHKPRSRQAKGLDYLVPAEAGCAPQHGLDSVGILPPMVQQPWERALPSKGWLCAVRDGAECMNAALPAGL